MANIKVSEMTEASTFDDGDYTMIVQANQNKKISRENILGDIESNIVNIESEISDIPSNIINTIYPIGSLYINTTGVNPSTFLGGTWESFGSGKVLVGQDTTDTDFDTLGETGGNKTHQHGYQQATTVNPSAGAGVIGRGNYTSSASSLQPYIVVSMWKRIA